MVERRKVLIGAAVVGGAAAVGAGTGAAEADASHDTLPVDKVVRTTCSPNCTGSCGQLAFVRDGRVVKIQQAADYPDKAYNPRGCMKGLSYLQQIHGDDRIMTPLIRTGTRGSGEFREATWDEALDRVAAELKRIGTTYGYDSIHVFGQVPGSGYLHKGANYRAAALLGMTHGTSFDFNGDLPMGMPITFGVQNAEHEAKDWANTRFALVVGANPLETRIPDAKFLLDAADAGAQIVVVDPTFSSTAAKADTWLRIEPGTDAAFALGVVNHVLASGLGDLDFVRTYSDAALLVRTDTGRRLREADLRSGGDPNRYVVWDAAAGAAAVIGTDRLGMPAGVSAALDGTYQIRTADGAVVACEPGWAAVSREVAKWTPEHAAEVCGASAEMIRRVAVAYATAEPAMIMMGGGTNHWFHGDMAGRAFALLATVTGNIGRSGGGFSVYVGQYKVRLDPSQWYNAAGKKAKIVPSVYFAYGPTPTMHPDVPYPKAGYKALFCTFANMFVQSADVNRLMRTVDGLDLVVVLDHQMTDTVKHADVVLPVASWYEKTDLTATPLHPFLQLQQAAIEPVGESRTELDIWRELVRRIAPEQASYMDVSEDDAVRLLLAASNVAGGPTEGITLEQLKEGPVRLRVPDPDIPFGDQIRNLTPFPPKQFPAPIEKLREFVPTGRIEFYKDDARFISAGETVPTYLTPHDDSVSDPARYPLRFLTPHSKWRIHSTYANNPWMREIHGDRAQVFMNPADADARGIRDDHAVEVFNERGSFVAWAVVDEAHKEGSVTVFEGWWPGQFARGRGVNELTSSEVNPIHEVHFVANMWSPSTGWKDCRCEVRRVS
ncbi:MAG: molybdopterin-dependent oxidoreductase [Acidimicrobiia bacterium]|nr:molybdopterin-dependent oxidoreductase [Acidimicrobiia bacterium]